MVKKIRLVNEDPSMETLDEQSYRRQMLEHQQAIDWKLWEMLKIMQSIHVSDDNTLRVEDATDKADKADE
jgi:hypothetical protein